MDKLVSTAARVCALIACGAAVVCASACADNSANDAAATAAAAAASGPVTRSSITLPSSVQVVTAN